MRSRAIVLSTGPERNPSQTVLLPPAGEVAPHVALPWVVRLRNGLLLGELVTIAVAEFLLKVDLPLSWLSAPIAITAISNYLLSRWQQGQPRDPERVLGWIFGLDTLCLTAVLSLCGGPLNPFSLLYLVQITVSAVVLRKAWAWALGALSVVCFGLLFWVHRPLTIFESHHQAQQFSVHLVGMWIAFAIAAALTAYFIGKVSEALRRREQEVLELQQQVARNQRLASLVTLAAGAAHELGTPLASIAVVSKEIERALAGRDAEMAEDARLIRSEVERCRRILQNMSARGAETSGEAPAPVPLPELLDRVRAQFSADQQRSIRLETGAEGAVLPPEATVQALAALVKNALDASAPQAPVILRAERTGEGIRFTVRDQGSGMSVEVLNRIAEPFFTTKEPGRGMGLGVFLVRLFAERLSGRLDFESESGRGTVVSLELPCPQVSMVSHVSL